MDLAHERRMSMATAEVPKRVLYGVGLAERCAYEELPPAIEEWLTILERSTDESFLFSSKPVNSMYAVRAIERGESLKEITPSLAFELLLDFLGALPKSVIDFNSFLDAASRIDDYEPAEFCVSLLKGIPLPYFSLLRRLIQLLHQMAQVHKLEDIILKSLVSHITPYVLRPPEGLSMSRKMLEKTERAILMLIQNSRSLDTSKAFDGSYWIRANHSRLMAFFKHTETIVSFSSLCAYCSISEYEMLSVVALLKEHITPMETIKLHLDLSHLSTSPVGIPVTSSATRLSARNIANKEKYPEIVEQVGKIKATRKAKSRKLTEQQKTTMAVLRQKKQEELRPLLKQIGAACRGKKEELVKRLIKCGYTLDGAVIE